MDKDRHTAGGTGHAQGGQDDGLHCHRAGSSQIRAEAAVKHNKDQTDRTDGVDCRIIVKLDVQKAVFSKTHTQGNKDEKGGDG